MSIVYVILYIHSDDTKLSETIGVSDDRKEAINHLIERAGYREVNGKMTYYYEPTDEYDSIESIFTIIDETNELHDGGDIYRIEKHKIL